MQINTRLPPVILPIRRTEGRAATSAIPPMTQLGASRAKTMALLLSLGPRGPGEKHGRRGTMYVTCTHADYHNVAIFTFWSKSSS